MMRKVRWPARWPIVLFVELDAEVTIELYGAGERQSNRELMKVNTLTDVNVM